MLRPRFQFRLRTLLVVVTIVGAACGYLAKQRQNVVDRRNFVQAHKASFHFRQSPSNPPGPLRRLLGDEEYTVIAMPLTSTNDERSSVARLFPESIIVAINPQFDITKDGSEANRPYIRFSDEPSENGSE